jgi:hypothetical protein
MNSMYRRMVLLIGALVPMICAADNGYGRAVAETPITGRFFLVVSLVALVVITRISMLRSNRVLQLWFVWTASLFSVIYLIILRETPMIYNYIAWNGTFASKVAHPLTNPTVGGALLGTTLAVLVFAVYATIRSRKYHDDVTVRILLGPLPFVAVVGLSFMAKEVFHNSEYWRMTRNAWEWVAFRIWLASAVLLAVAVTAEVRMRMLRRPHQ